MYDWSASVFIQKCSDQRVHMVTWCVHTHQCVFVEVQRLESSHGVYILISVSLQKCSGQRVQMVCTYSSVCVRRSAVAREFTWCVHTHQCVFVEVQRLESPHGVYILISVCSQKCSSQSVHMVYTHSSVCTYQMAGLLEGLYKKIKIRKSEECEGRQLVTGIQIRVHIFLQFF